MTTLDAWIDETKRHLLSGERENLNVLNGSITNSATTLIYTYSQGGILEGATLEIDLELMYVVSVNTGTKTATVIRGMFSTTAVSHSSAALITVNPRFPRFSVFSMLNQEINDLSTPQGGLFAVGSTTITAASGVTGYDIASATGFMELIEVHYEADTVAKWWKRVDNWRVVENADTTDFPSGRGLMIADDGFPSGATLRLTFRKTFTTVASNSTNIESDSGLTATMMDIPPIGAAARLMLMRGARRAFDDSQGEPRRASEVPDQAAANIASALLSFKARRVGAEAARLHRQYPTRLAR